MPVLFTILANVPLALSSLAKLVTEWRGPETVIRSSELWQAGTMSAGQRSIASAHVRPNVDEET